MPRNPPSCTIFITIIICLICVSNVSLCHGQELTELQSQARMYRDQGWKLQSEGDIPQAFSFYQKAMLVDPNYVVAYNDAAVILEASGRQEEAKLLYLKAISIDPDYPNSYSNLALFYESCGDYPNAIANWVKRAFLGGPNDPWAQAARNRLEDIARLYPQSYRMVGQTLSSDPEVAKDNSEAEIKAKAASYLKQAKESYSKGDYVTALREATLAEYLGSSDTETSAFVMKVRKRLIQ